MNAELRIGLATALVAALATFAPAGAASAVAQVGLAPSIHIGWGVNATTGGSLCTTASLDRCRSGVSSGEASGFQYPNSVAVDPRTGNLYVADSANNRVQELTAAGAFLSAFGWDVDETEDRRADASQAQRNVCTAASGDLCTAGVRGTAAGQLAYPAGLAVAPVSGDVYVLEVGVGDYRLDKFSAGGHFLWMTGGHVNDSSGANLCTEREVESGHVRCGPGVEQPSESLASRAFKFAQFDGDLLAFGGPEDLLYVGDEHELQELTPEGSVKRSILLASLSAAPNSDVAALALDPRGDVYLVYRVLTPNVVGGEEADVIHELNPRGEQVAQLTVQPTQPGATVTIDGVAVDPGGVLAAIGNENGSDRFGALYDTASGRRVGSFTGPSDNDGIALNANGDLYVAATDDQEVVGYAPAPATELVSGLGGCAIEGVSDPVVELNCDLEDGESA